MAEASRAIQFLPQSFQTLPVGEAAAPAGQRRYQSLPTPVPTPRYYPQSQAYQQYPTSIPSLTQNYPQYQPPQHPASAPSLTQSYPQYQSLQQPISAPTPEQSGITPQQYSSLNSYPPQPQSVPYFDTTAYQQTPADHTLAGDQATPLNLATYGTGIPSSQAQAQPAQASDSYEPKDQQHSGNALARISVYEGEEPHSFTSAKALANYIRLFPEAENDQACRAFKYGSNCSPSLLMPLLEHFDFPRYSLFPYGLANDYWTPDPWKAGLCRCEKCSKSEPCGQYVLFKNFRFYQQSEARLSPRKSARVSTNGGTIEVSNGST